MKKASTVTIAKKKRQKKLPAKMESLGAYDTEVFSALLLMGSFLTPAQASVKDAKAEVKGHLRKR